MEDQIIDGLTRVRDRLMGVVEATTDTVIVNSADPRSMQTAFAALDGRVSGGEGRRALREALTADGISVEVVDRLDALYIRCLLDPTLED